MTKSKKWKIQVAGKRRVLTLKIAALLEQTDACWERRVIVERAFALIGEYGYFDRLRKET